MYHNVRIESDQPVDAVILWVDGNDPVLTAKRASYIEQENIGKHHSGAISTRFASSSEIRYCVLSILKFASFIRNIFIVTDNQNPGLDEEVEKYFPGRSASIRIVDHKEIFRDYEKYLPTFNSSSILTMVWRIEGLAGNFVCFSDDVMLTREISYEDWFAGGRPVLRGYWRLPPLRKMLGNSFKVLLNKSLRGKRDYQPRISFYMRQWKSARLAGMRYRYFFHCHTPHPVNRNLIENYFNDKQRLLEKNIAYRFRNSEQLLLTALANQIEILTGNKNLTGLDLVYIHPYYSERRLMKKISECRNKPGIKFLCVQSLEMLDEKVQQNIIELSDSILKLDKDE